MSKRRFVEEFEYGDAKGLDTTSPASMVGPGFVRDARNVNLGATGGYSKRKGYSSQLSTAWAGRSVRQGYEYFRSAVPSSSELLLFGENGINGILGKVSGGAVVDIQTGLATNRLSLVQLGDQIFGFNGDSTNAPFVYDGVAARTALGLAAPSVAPTAAAVAGSGLEIGSYVVAYSYILVDSNSNVVAESSPSTLVTQTTSASNQQIDVTVTASGVLLTGFTVKIRIYRTVVSGTVLFLDREVGDASTTYSLNNTDATVSAQKQIEFDNGRLDDYSGYTKARFPVVARNRLFVAHDTKNEVRFSKISFEGPRPETFPAVNFVNVENKRGFSDQVVGMGEIKGVPIVLKERSIGRLEEVGLPEITRSEDPVTYIYREITDSVGAIHHEARTQVFDELIFLGRDNIYGTNGQTVRPIANTIQATIKALDFRSSNISKMSMFNDTKERRIYVSVMSTGNTESNKVLVGDYQQYPNFRWTTYEEGSTSSTHPGIRAGSFFHVENSTDGSKEVYFGNTDGNGQYFKMNTGNKDIQADATEKGIFFKLVSRPYTMSQPLITKLYKGIRVFVEAADDTYDIEFCTIYDLAAEEEKCEDFSIPGIGDNWDEENWSNDAGTTTDPLTWAGPNLAELTYDPHRKAKFMQLVFNQTGADAPVTLLGWGVSGSIFGGI